MEVTTRFGRKAGNLRLGARKSQNLGGRVIGPGGEKSELEKRRAKKKREDWCLQKKDTGLNNQAKGGGEEETGNHEE